jgi:hypothetical protein
MLRSILYHYFTNTHNHTNINTNTQHAQNAQSAQNAINAQYVDNANNNNNTSNGTNANTHTYHSIRNDASFNQDQNAKEGIDALLSVLFASAVRGVKLDINLYFIMLIHLQRYPILSTYKKQIQHFLFNMLAKDTDSHTAL